MTTNAASTHVEVAPLAEYAPLFPLPLAPFERFLLQDERPGYPMTFFVEMVFLGKMNLSALRQAVVDAAARHPLLLARVESSRRWTLSEVHRIPFVHLAGDAMLDAAIDLRKESGLRIGMREDSERTTVVCQFHHACCDGEGSRFFGFDLLTAYSRLMSETPLPEWTRVDYERLRERAAFSPPVADGKAKTTSFSQKLRDAYNFHVLGPSTLAPARDASREVDWKRPLIHTHLFSREETSRLETRAAEIESNLNDVAIALLFQTLATWNQERGSASSKQRLRILMPADMRERADRRLTAANRVGFSFLGRTIEQCREWKKLLAGVAEETKYIKGIRIGIDFLQILSLVQRVPGILPLVARLPRSLATTVLTNLGDTTRRFRKLFPTRDGYPVIGDVLLEQVIGAPPLRPGTRSGFGICFCAGHMALSLRCDPHYFDSTGAESLLNAYVAAWRDWAAEKCTPLAPSRGNPV